MKILIIYDQSAPKYHRLLLPLVYMPGIEIVSTHQITEALCTDIDILYFNRLIPGCAIKQVCAWRQVYGFKIVVDFDDHWFLDKDHYLYETYQEQKLSLFMLAWLDEADAVTVTHERLAVDAREVNKNVYVLPNAIPQDGQFLAKRTESDLTRLFWAGGITHEKDIELLKLPVREFKNLPIQMVMGGYSKNKSYHKMRNYFTNYGKLNNELIEGLPVNDYYYMYSKCDISLIPLTDTRFNSYKSNLKILEAANIGANVVVSNVDPYKDVPYVNYVDTPKDWYGHVKWLLDNPDEARRQAWNLNKYCNDNFNFERINKTRKDILCNLIIEHPLKNIETSTTPG